MTIQRDEAPACPNSVLGKAFSILSVFESSDALRLVELSQGSGVPKPSVYRLAQELVELGLLEKDGSRYRLGMGAYALGQRVGNATELLAAARPVLVDLYSATRSTVHLAVLEGDSTYYLEKMGGIKSVHVLTQPGARLPLSCTASGKLLLANAPEPVREAILQRLAATGLPRLTERSQSSLAALRQELVTISERRFAVEREEALVAFKSFAVPVTDPGGTCLAALSAVVPSNHEADKELLFHLWSAAAGIGRQYARALAA